LFTVTGLIALVNGVLTMTSSGWQHESPATSLLTKQPNPGATQAGTGG
jgi:hypothetical protein